MMKQKKEEEVMGKEELGILNINVITVKWYLHLFPSRVRLSMNDTPPFLNGRPDSRRKIRSQNKTKNLLCSFEWQVQSYMVQARVFCI